MEETKPVFSVRCEKCGKYTEDVYQRSSDRMLLYNPTIDCEDGGRYTIWLDGVDTQECVTTMLDISEDEADLGGYTPELLAWR